ncbi:heparan N-sulfatase [Actinocatenispora thailandica]|uniref:Heparan N-sulfatase n=1 Tax=Actinocatenispora thailandica TaxID=227318 RepID=A0A7R7HXS9_9ACTN|nr:sulfatase [Actinocatenispora thailandica]BCJ36288.1 heparan N-sulfatase [Actinocatenispora thailandica]
MSRPNIVYFHTHDTGRYVEPYGAPIRTPRMQGFAEEAVMFRNAHAVAPTCSPSRAGLLTGQWAHTAGMLGLAHRGHRLDDYDRHLVHTLHRHGYTSALVGVQHVASGAAAATRTIGYHEELPVAGRLAPARRDAACRYLRRHHDRPFFLSVGLMETHTMPDTGFLFGHPGGDDRWTAPAPTMPNAAVTRQDMASFHAAARQVDETLGAVLDTLREEGLADDTVVLVTTDHGIAMPGMKCTLGATGTGVLLMLRAPGLPAGLAVDTLVSQVDVFPTLCELLGIDPPPWLQGRSMLPALGGRPIREETFAEVTYHVAYQPQRAIRTERWLYVKDFEGRDRPRLRNVDDSASKALWVDAGWAEQHTPPVRLHDLMFDPHEQRDLADRPATATIQQDLDRRLDRWMRATGDPLVHGPVPPPPAGSPGPH